MSLSPFDHPFLSGLFGDAAVANHFSVAADIDAMVSFEVALAHAEAEAGVISLEAAREIAAALAGFRPDLVQLRVASGVDGVVVPNLVSQIRKALPATVAPLVHRGATSQDVIDTSLMLRLKAATALICERLEALISGFEHLGQGFGSNRLTGHTRMQAAIPITVSDRLAAWCGPLMRSRQALLRLLSDGFALQFGGAAGTLDGLGDKGPSVRATLARQLGLIDVPQWHSQRDRITGLGDLLSLISGSLGKFGQDVALLAQQGGEIRMTGGGASSAMPHKQNPVAAETLVTLARFNAVQVSGLHQSLVHEQERSGAAWGLEWLILPSMVVATGAATLTGLRLQDAIADLGLPPTP